MPISNVTFNCSDTCYNKNDNTVSKHIAQSSPQYDTVSFSGKNKKSDKKNNVAKVILLSVAGLIAVAGGVLLHKNYAAKKALKTSIEDSKSILMRQAEFSELNIKTEMAQRIERISKLPLNEQKAELKKLEEINGNIYELSIMNKRLDIENCGLPQNVVNAVKEGKFFEAGELYTAHLYNLPRFTKVPNTGNTFEETVINVFGTKTKIPKHTYDLKKESQFAAVQRNFGGFQEAITSNEGLVYSLKYSEEQKQIIKLIGDPQSSWKNSEVINLPDRMYLRHGKAKNNKYVVELSLNDPAAIDTNGNHIPMGIFVSSPNSKMTPVQQDLLKIAQNPEKLDLDMLSQITKIAPEHRPDLPEKMGIPKTANIKSGWRNFDYDLLLSAIQKMAK